MFSICLWAEGAGNANTTRTNKHKYKHYNKTKEHKTRVCCCSNETFVSHVKVARVGTVSRQFVSSGSIGNAVSALVNFVVPLITPE